MGNQDYNEDISIPVAKSPIFSQGTRGTGPVGRGDRPSPAASTPPVKAGHLELPTVSLVILATLASVYAAG